MVLIENREMAATILQDGYGQGQRCVEIAAKLVKNEAVEYSDLATKSVFFPVMLDSFWSGSPRRARLTDSNWVGWGSNPQTTPKKAIENSDTWD